MKTCNATTYCRINKSQLRPMGSGYKLKCPVCDTIFDNEKPIEKTSPAKNQKVLDQISVECCEEGGGYPEPGCEGALWYPPVKTLFGLIGEAFEGYILEQYGWEGGSNKITSQ